MRRAIKVSSFFIRVFNWEFWPFHVVYSPIYPVWLWYCLKARSFFFFAAANPRIKNGGFLMESKTDIYNLLPPQHTPITLSFSADTPLREVLEKITEKRIPYPLVVKPDIGMQGKAVIKVNSARELANTVGRYTVNYIIQPFVEYPNELGIFYVRDPRKKSGKVTGIVEKEFLTIVGNGTSTMEELLCQNKRYILQVPTLRETLREEFYKIPQKGEICQLVPYGNHARGSLFLDSTGKNNPKIEGVIDKVCQAIPGFYYGRLDIRFTNFEDLENNRNWCIIELNGAGSEPTHIYDPRHSIIFAWKEIILHWRLLYQVSILNKQSGESYLSWQEGIQMFKENTQYLNKLGKIQLGGSL